MRTQKLRHSALSYDDTLRLIELCVDCNLCIDALLRFTHWRMSLAEIDCMAAAMVAARFRITVAWEAEGDCGRLPREQENTTFH